MNYFVNDQYFAQGARCNSQGCFLRASAGREKPGACDSVTVSRRTRSAAGALGLVSVDEQVGVQGLAPCRYYYQWVVCAHALFVVQPAWHNYYFDWDAPCAGTMFQADLRILRRGEPLRLP